MDADEALARTLQAMELQHDGSSAFDKRLRVMMETALRCEDPRLQEQARAVMPLDRMNAAIDEAVGLASRLGGDVTPPAREDLMARQMLNWFKKEFFSWVDTLPCTSCGSTSTRPQGMVDPTADDLAGGATRVEFHRCVNCGGGQRFPRYNHPGRLLQPGCRRGRCGEWANAFLLCCRAVGLTARYVSDWSDHVWTEYYSHAARRWIHLDSCEASYDQPLLYESGWGKAVSYVVAAGVWGLVDVTARYTKRWRAEVIARRTLVSERWLAVRCDEVTAARRAGWPEPRRRVWLGRDAGERMELLRQRLGLRPAVQSSQPLPGRTTGSLQWRQQRGEIGTSAAAPSGPRLPTSYRMAPDGPQRLPPVFARAGRLSGGVCRAAGHNETQETVERLFDGRAATKWLDFNGGGPSGSSWIEYRLPTDLPAAVLHGYELVSANDCPERDPASWRLEGVTQLDFEAGRSDQWTLLDHRSGIRFPHRHMARTFQPPTGPSPPCRRLKLTITATANPPTANSVQLACWNLYGSGGGGSGGGVGGVNTSIVVRSQAVLRFNLAKEDVATLLRQATTQAGPTVAAARGTATVEVGTVVGSQPNTAVSLLSRLLENIQREPQESRYRKVRCTKVMALMESAPLAEVLLSFLKFRPVLMPAELEAGAVGATVSADGGRKLVPDGEDVFLMMAMDASGEYIRRIEQVLECLKNV